MLLSKKGLEKRMGAVGAKLEKVKSRLIVPGQRNEECVQMHVSSRILKNAENAYFSGKYQDPIRIGFENLAKELGNSAEFSGYGGNAPYSDGQGSYPARGAEDISIFAAMASLEAYLVAPRSLSAPDDSVSYENIVSMTDRGNLKKGDVVTGPFSPFNLNTDLAPYTQEFKADVTNITFGNPIAKGGVLVTVTDGDATKPKTLLIGRDNDPSQVGVIQWSVPADAPAYTSAPPIVTINYTGGVVTLGAAITNGTITLVADPITDATGGSITRVRPDYPTVVIHSIQRDIILESSQSAESYRNKMLASQIAGGMTVDVGAQALREITEAHVGDLNRLFVSGIVKAGEISKLDNPNGSYIEGDITAWSLQSSQSGTYDKMIDQFILDMQAQLLTTTGHGASFILVGPIGLTKIALNKTSFVPGPAFVSDVDAFVGTYNAIPVIRHRAVDLLTAGKTRSRVYMGYKDPSGRAAAVLWGEYLGPSTTSVALNFANPQEYSRGLFSYSGIACPLPNLVVAGEIVWK